MKQAGSRRIGGLSCMCFFVVSALLVFAGPSDFLESTQHAVYASSKAVKGQDKTTVVEL